MTVQHENIKLRAHVPPHALGHAFEDVTDCYSHQAFNTGMLCLLAEIQP